MVRSVARGAFGALYLVASFAAAAEPLPVFPPGDTRDTFFGTVVADPYRAMEDTKAPAVADWMKAHAAHAERTLQNLGLRASVLATLKKYDDSTPARVASPVRVPGGRVFYTKRGVADDQYKLYVREPDGRERLLVDTDRFAKEAGGVPHAINWFRPSRDGRHVAYGVSAAGTESASMRVVDVRSGRQRGDAVPRTDWGAVEWSLDGRRLYFLQLAELPADASPLDKYRNVRTMTLALGASAASARPVLAAGMPGLRIAAEEFPGLALSDDGRYAFAVVVNGVQREQRVYASSAKAFAAGKPRWTLLFDHDAGIGNWTYARGTLYAVTHRSAPRRALVAGPVDGFDATRARVLVPASERVLLGVGAAADALYVEARDGNVKRLSKRPLLTDGRGADAPSVDVPLPVDGTFELTGFEGQSSATDPRLPGVLIELQGYTRARQIYEVRADGSVRNTGLQPAGAYDAPADIAVTGMECTSHDGTKVPMSVVHRRGLVFDGSHPTLLYGYASYGITEEPYYSTGRLAFIEHGGVLAVANPRGSGVYGEAWHKAGFQTTKPNTWKDFIACAETLIARRVTQPAKLGILGGSAGGILVGRAMTERPELFAAVVPAVGALDMVRAEVTPNGVPNIPEFGTRRTEPGFRALLEMSTLHQIRDGVKYPAVLLTHGVNDPRVEVWHTTKTAARLMAASSSGAPVLVRLDYTAGHGIGNTKAQQQAERADTYAFLLWQLGVPGAGPTKDAAR